MGGNEKYKNYRQVRLICLCFGFAIYSQFGMSHKHHSPWAGYKLRVSATVHSLREEQPLRIV